MPEVTARTFRLIKVSCSVLPLSMRIPESTFGGMVHSAASDFLLPHLLLFAPIQLCAPVRGKPLRLPFCRSG